MKSSGDEYWIAYSNEVRKRYWGTFNNSKSRSSSKEGDALYLVGLEGHYVLRDSSNTRVEYLKSLERTKGIIRNIFTISITTVNDT